MRPLYYYERPSSRYLFMCPSNKSPHGSLIKLLYQGQGWSISAEFARATGSRCCSSGQASNIISLKSSEYITLLTKIYGMINCVASLITTHCAALRHRTLSLHNTAAMCCGELCLARIGVPHMRKAARRRLFEASTTVTYAATPATLTQTCDTVFA
jgi:hypothetical protein